MLVTQFWAQGAAPDEVEALMGSWAASPYRYRRFDDESARDYIAAHFEPRFVTAFEQSESPLMRSDMLRLCTLLRDGGLWMDADIGLWHPLEPLLDPVKRALLYAVPNGTIHNDVMFFRAPGDPLVAHLADLVCENINRVEGKAPPVQTVKISGPVAITRAQQQDPALFEGIDFTTRPTLREYLNIRYKMQYKSEGPWWGKRFLTDPAGDA
ncbi:hypothetical protein ATO13_15005 [Stappia sp. 22II-S9-Z10]|nr:hypothetical protein ATO13_15005 [Stappia sp. 22II-S9-Z10]